jgi:hypothetical protein
MAHWVLRLKRESQRIPAVNGTRSFLLGTVLGLGVSGVVYYLFGFVVDSAASYAIISGVTLLGFGLAIGGYLVYWRGDRSFTTYFLTGLGIGILIVAFIGAGNGTNPLYGSD